MTRNFPNLAGSQDADAFCFAELTEAGIEIHRLPESVRNRNTSEVPTIVIGGIGRHWTFERAWRYWVATGPGIPPEYANKLHETHGTQCRVDGHCGCPSPKEWFGGFAVGHYHVDTQEGLNALAATIRQVMEDAKENENGD